MAQTGNSLPTSTVTQARVRLFEPTQRPSMRNGDWTETAWGKCRISGRLGQRHADVLETCMRMHESIRVDEDPNDSTPGITLLIDPARIRRELGSGQYSQEQLWLLLGDLRSATIEIVAPGMHIMGGLLNHVEKSQRTVHNPLTKGERYLWRLPLGKALIQLIQIDNPLWYKPGPLTKLQYGISQAVARHVLTHTNAPASGWTIDGLIHAVSDDTGSMALRNARRRLRADELGLNALDIVISGDRLTRATPAR